MQAVGLQPKRKGHIPNGMP